MAIHQKGGVSVRLTDRGRRVLLAAAVGVCFAVGFLTADLGLPGWSA